jgi:hypothetical protein
MSIGREFRRSSMRDDLASAREAISADPRPVSAPRQEHDARRALKRLGVTGIVGVLLSGIGLGLLAAAFDHTFMEPRPDESWEDVQGIGAAVLGLGLFLAVTAIIGAFVVGVQALRRAS